MIAQSAYIFFDFKKYIGDKRPNSYPKNYNFPNSYPFHPTTAQTAESLFPYLDIMRGIHRDELHGDKKIYVSRKNFPERKLENEENLEKFLSDKNLAKVASQMYRQLPVEFQHDYFHYRSSIFPYMENWINKQSLSAADNKPNRINILELKVNCLLLK